MFGSSLLKDALIIVLSLHLLPGSSGAFYVPIYRLWALQQIDWTDRSITLPSLLYSYTVHVPCFIHSEEIRGSLLAPRTRSRGRPEIMARKNGERGYRMHSPQLNKCTAIASAGYCCPLRIDNENARTMIHDSCLSLTKSTSLNHIACCLLIMVITCWPELLLPVSRTVDDAQ